MGGGASSLIRLRKAIIIRSYNLRKPEETVDQQFRKFAVRGEDGILIISLHNIRNCLEMEAKEYDWIDHLFLRIFGGQVTTVSYSDFIKFLESGKAPETLSTIKKHETSYGTPPIPPNNTNVQATPSLSHSSSSSSYRSVADVSSIRIERMVRSSSNANNSYYNNNKSNNSSRASLHADRDGLLDTAEDGSLGMGPGIGIGSQDGAELDAEEGDEEVLHINLSSAMMNPHSLPESVKLQSHDGFIARPASRQSQQHGEGEEGLVVVDDTYTVIVHPSRSANKLSASDSPAKPLWRKRETVRQERTVHYTTIDASGEQQELIEKETTQSEVLHMECKETGQFAHRETTQYEQLETFNAEVVAETKGAEEYVHLKSLEDEYHYMESTMPNKDGGGEGEEGQQQQQQSGEGGEEEGMYGEPVPHGTAEEAATAQAAMEAEYAEAYHLYHQKCREQQERGEAPSEQDEACADMFRMSPRQQPPPPFSDDTHQAQGFGSGYSSSNNNTGCEGPSRGRGRGSGRSAEDERARDAFAFAEGMEDLDEPPVLQEEEEEKEEEEEEAEQSQLFGEHIPCTNGNSSSSGGNSNSNSNNLCPAPVTPPPPATAAASRQGRGLRGKEYLFEPSDGTDTPPSPSTSSSSGQGVGASNGIIIDSSSNSNNDMQHLPPRIPIIIGGVGGGVDAVATAQSTSVPTDDYLSRTSSYESLHEID